MGATIDIIRPGSIAVSGGRYNSAPPSSTATQTFKTCLEHEVTTLNVRVRTTACYESTTDLHRCILPSKPM
jgi:hypothetical protein